MFLCGNKSLCSDIGEIYSIEYPDDNKIWFGAFRVSDTGSMNFHLKKLNTELKLRTLITYPTLVWSATPNSDTPLDYDNFSVQNAEEFPIDFDIYSPSANIKILYTAISSEGIGRKEVLLILGFIDANDITATEALYVDTFYLISKTTNLAIDGYDDFVHFDSVFINQVTPVNFNWRVRNTVLYNLDATEQSIKLLSPAITGNEFSVEEKQYPLTFYPGTNKIYQSWNFGYSPKDTFPDSALFKLIFNDTANNRIDTAQAKLYGVGVEHKLFVTDTLNCTVRYDTIDMGEVRVGEQKTASIKMRNTGNIKYGLLKQGIYDMISDSIIDYFKLEVPFCNETNLLDISAQDSFNITFAPYEKGIFIAKYVLENDFKSRKIKSNNANDYRQVFIIKGIGVEPSFKTMIDSIDFGSVSFGNASENCPTYKDTTLVLYNTGNADLIINNIISNNMAFNVSKTELLIPKNSSGSIIIRFNASAPERLETGTIYISTNEHEANTYAINLSANAIPPIRANLQIPNVKNKPGSILTLPIYLTNENDSSISRYSSSYSFELHYNPAMLRYYKYQTINTASEGNFPFVEEIAPGVLRISCYKDYGNFSPVPILLKLQFNTYLASNISTELAIQNAKIGINNVCDDYMKLEIKNGRWSIDSICGLEVKLNETNGDNYNFDINHNSNITEVLWTLPFHNVVSIRLCNVLGDILQEEIYDLPSGTFSKNIDLSRYSAGYYYITFSSGLYYKVIPIMK